MNDVSTILSNLDIDYLCQLAIKAGDGIMNVYNDLDQNFEISFKSDNSPLTKADKISHEIIKEGLTSKYPNIPLISEEGAQIPYSERAAWTIFWCVDPLDGTKEFIKRNGEFTVNIALIVDNKSVLGIIYQPTTKTLYYSSNNIGSWKKHADEIPLRLETQKPEKEWTSVGSRSHNSPDEDAILAPFPINQKISVGSSLKFCFVAEGKAQIYCRIGPTMEWDTAAGQAIAENAGATMIKLDGAAFTYNKESLLNTGFICKIV